MRLLGRADHGVAGTLAKAAMAVTFVSLLAVGWLFSTLSPGDAQHWLTSEPPNAAQGAGRAAVAAAGGLAQRAASLELNPCGLVQVR
ncbi:hypothetical protein [Chelatococcus reniformis]|uniref:Uncharacterized protein n=1 Tax=Chelatococcus reniformis TaxID=1494448 RepID=A0A916U193_9HYPH|nr:hypothetical protein [Chelatococcus reniformis]GGC55929.1 hypothetical protein GCM10010994_13590 [Chelatococcus reniformis]